MGKEKVFVFYKLSKDRLFWYELHSEWKKDMARVIANMLLA